MQAAADAAPARCRKPPRAHTCAVCCMTLAPAWPCLHLHTHRPSTTPTRPAPHRQHNIVMPSLPGPGPGPAPVSSSPPAWHTVTTPSPQTTSPGAPRRRCEAPGPRCPPRQPTRKHRDAGARLPVPDADGLVVAGADDPGVLVVELHRPDVVQVAQQREETPALNQKCSPIEQPSQRPSTVKGHLRL